MDIQQVSVKLFASTANVKQSEFIGVFHRWIREKKLSDQLMIDVADYKHVHHGPGVMIICDAAHYSMDEADGRLGLLYAAKRDPMGSASEKFTDAVSAALEACHLLENDPDLSQRINFDGSEIQIRILSRLVASNTDDAFEVLSSALESAMSGFYPQGVKIERTGTDRGPFQVTVKSASNEDVATLIARG